MYGTQQKSREHVRVNEIDTYCEDTYLNTVRYCKKKSLSSDLFVC